MTEAPEFPQPNAALKRLERLVGSWKMEGNLVRSDEKNISGETTFSWVAGGFFLEQRVRIDFMGLQIDSVELIGHDPRVTPFRRRCTRISRLSRCRTGGTSGETT